MSKKMTMVIVTMRKPEKDNYRAVLDISKGEEVLMCGWRKPLV